MFFLLVNFHCKSNDGFVGGPVFDLKESQHPRADRNSFFSLSDTANQSEFGTSNQHRKCFSTNIFVGIGQFVGFASGTRIGKFLLNGWKWQIVEFEPVFTIRPVRSDKGHKVHCSNILPVRPRNWSKRPHGRAVRMDCWLMLIRWLFLIDWQNWLYDWPLDMADLIPVYIPPSTYSLPVKLPIDVLR